MVLRRAVSVRKSASGMQWAREVQYKSKSQRIPRRLFVSKLCILNYYINAKICVLIKNKTKKPLNSPAIPPKSLSLSLSHPHFFSSQISDFLSVIFLADQAAGMDLPVIDLSHYLAASTAAHDSELGDSRLTALCAEVSRTLRETGALLVKDPRCSADDNDRFIDMMEKYFECPSEFKFLQERPHLHYQVIRKYGFVRFS